MDVCYILRTFKGFLMLRIKLMWHEDEALSVGKLSHSHPLICTVLCFVHYNCVLVDLDSANCWTLIIGLSLVSLDFLWQLSKHTGYCGRKQGHFIKAKWMRISLMIWFPCKYGLSGRPLVIALPMISGPINQCAVQFEQRSDSLKLGFAKF